MTLLGGAVKLVMNWRRMILDLSSVLGKDINVRCKYSGTGRYRGHRDDKSYNGKSNKISNISDDLVSLGTQRWPK